jgi:DNA-binding MarR family transcriptional regulator
VPASQADRDLAAALSALHRQVDLVYGTIARRFGLTTQQIELLCHLTGHTPSFGELATSLGCDKTNVTGMVDRLERRGLVHRTPDPTDRRISRATLSDQGAALAPQIRAAIAETMADSLGSLDTSQRDALTALAHTAAHALRARPPALSASAGAEAG